ncbi:rCG63218 [Rattus norvegicus]|uniref:RCG63218 n=1 Tax=Rattus norvegicus TaxID=10116 RepID=A6JR90_RAT|nr:rCG63218 [Rattus norvegicus]
MRENANIIQGPPAQTAWVALFSVYSLRTSLNNSYLNPLGICAILINPAYRQQLNL